ncbi:Zn-dependent exopeptidase M28 [Paenibacillus caui]|uniref:Zn-dependent exopeptidase M28 n=1 Tax=Paenibacillus caui TaxID=2873927 RepID=UPI001CA92250|nr:Zn-dependent exopeptidase M28 [Paenibacillus caui]
MLGVICIWNHISADNAKGQYLPFTTDHRQCPALWVGQEDGEALKQAAMRKAKARLILQADVDHTAGSDTIYAMLPGRNDAETIIVNTHTDGPNACEENGGVALLAMAKYFSQIREEQRNRSIVFVFVTGHFQIPQFGIKGQATTRWLKDHPELWNGEGTNKQAVAGITIEHLGCTEWKDDQKHAHYQFTGEIDNELVFTANRAMDSIYLNCIQGRTKVRTITLKPKGKFYFGEGQPLYEANIPTISLVPGPDYLCAVGDNGHIDKIDPDLMYEQIETFTKVVSVIDHMKSEELGKPEPASFSFLGWLGKGE